MKVTPLLILAFVTAAFAQTPARHEGSLKGLKKSLTTLALGMTHVTDIGPLKDLESLTELYLDRTEVSDLGPLKDLKSLTTLSLTGTRMTDLAQLKDLKSLTVLNLSSSKVSDVGPLKELKNLTTLDLSHTPVSDVEPLKELRSLKRLNLCYTQVSNVGPLKDLKNLTELSLCETTASDASLDELRKNLPKLQIYGKSIKGREPVAAGAAPSQPASAPAVTESPNLPGGTAQQSPPSDSETTGAAKPEVKTGKIEENHSYKSARGMFSITVPPAGNFAVRTYEWQAAQLKHDTRDYELVVFTIFDFGEAYTAGVRRIPQSVVAEMAKEEEKQTLSNLANGALVLFRENYAEEPKPVDEVSVQTQFGQGLLRTYLAPHSSLLSRGTGPGHVGDIKFEKFDAYIAVLVVKKDDRFIYATAEDDSMQMGPGAASNTKPDLRKALQSFFASMTVAGLSSTPQPPSGSESAGTATPNSGKPSQQETPRIFMFCSVAFTTPQSGWAVGIPSIILHTEDGGGSWRPQTSVSRVSGSRPGVPGVFFSEWYPNSVAFATPLSGWAVGGMGGIQHTEDGGASWKTQASHTNAQLYSVAFATPQSGWAVGEGGTILHTENGGGDWKPQREQAGVGPNLISVVFATPQSGWAVGGNGIILHTEDGGGSWKPQSSGTSEMLNSVAFVTPQLGWTVGWKGIILHTEDGGGSWKPQSSGTSATLNSISFATPQLGWAVGLKGILHTEDGGVTWTTQSSGNSYSLLSVAFATPKSGWAVGLGGVILHTEDGGATWKKQYFGNSAD